MGLGAAPSLLPCLQSLSWHKDMILCHSPEDVLPLASFGPWTTPLWMPPGFTYPTGVGPAVLTRWESVNIWNSYMKSMELCSLTPTAEPDNLPECWVSPFSPGNYTVFDFIFPRNISSPVNPLPGPNIGSKNVHFSPSPEYVSVAEGAQQFSDSWPFPSCWKLPSLQIK